MYLTLWLMCKKALGQELHWVDACFCSVRGGLFSNDRSGSVRGLLLMRRCGAGELSMVLLLDCVHFLLTKKPGAKIQKEAIGAQDFQVYVHFCQLQIMQRYKIIVCGLDIFGLASLKLCR